MTIDVATSCEMHVEECRDGSCQPQCWGQGHVSSCNTHVWWRESALTLWFSMQERPDLRAAVKDEKLQDLLEASAEDAVKADAP